MLKSPVTSLVPLTREEMKLIHSALFTHRMEMRKKAQFLDKADLLTLAYTAIDIANESTILAEKISKKLYRS